MGKGKKQRIKNSTDFSIQKDQTQSSPEIQSIGLRVKATIGKKKKNTAGFLLWHWTLEDSSSILTCCCYSLCVSTPANAEILAVKRENGWKGMKSQTVSFSTCQQQPDGALVAQLQRAVTRAHYQPSQIELIANISHALALHR